MPIFKRPTIIFFMPKSFVAAFLCVVYALSFGITPYWTYVQTPMQRVGLYIFSLGAGLFWALISAAKLRARLDIKNLPIIAILALGILGLNYRQLTGGLPWRGDEDFHIRIIGMIIQNIPSRWFLLAIIVIFILLGLSWSKPKWAGACGFLLAAAFCVAVFKWEPYREFSSIIVLRYPFVSYWLASLAPKLAKVFAHPYSEYLYRLLPIGFAILLASFVCISLPFKDNPARFTSRVVWGVAIATIPLLLYYSSIFYLEMPAVFLMVIVSYRIGVLLTANHSEIKNDFGWYALILIGLIKETTIPFLLSFLVCRWLVQGLQAIKNHQFQPLLNQPFSIPLSVRALRERFLGELGIAFSVLFPLFFYILLRSSLTSTRSFSLNLENLFLPQVYAAIGKSFIDQFGWFLLLFLCGLILLVVRKKYAQGLFLGVVLVSTLAFHTIDNWTYVGYSRFNLFILPVVLAGASFALFWIIERKMWINYALAALILVSNIMQSPLNGDGTKQPFWDDYNSDVSEHYYPYPEALAWLSKQHPDQAVLFAGVNFPYYWEFYFNKYEWWPDYEVSSKASSLNETRRVHEYLVEATQNGFPIVLYQVAGNKAPSLEENNQFHIERVFQNEAHMLIAFTQEE